MTRLAGYDAGLVVSASHNPYRDNGIKVFSRDGGKIPDRLELVIERRVLDGPGSPQQEKGPPGERPASPGSTGARAPAPLDHAALAGLYLDRLQGALPGRSLPGRPSIVLDCGHGAASVLAPELFRRAGADVTAIHDRPDGRNINLDCGTLHPERLAAEVRTRGALLGLAFDGDADRCLVVDSTGRVLDGDYVLYLAAREMKGTGRLSGAAVVGTVMCNLWLEKALRADGVRLVRAPVGDKYVLEEMQKGGFVLGGEPSGHIIFLERSTTGDGLLTGLLFLELLLRTGVDLAAWAATVRPCPQVLLNVPVRERPPLDSHPRIGPAIRDEVKRLGESGRLLVRYSGTEPQARIMVEGEERHAVEQAAGRLQIVIQEEIGLEP